MKNLFPSSRNTLLIVFLSVFNQMIFCQSQSMKPEKVHRIVYTQKANEWYMQQAKLWEKEVNKDFQNPEAWLNYYMANRYANFPKGFSDFTEDKQQRLNDIVAEMGKTVPNSYEYNYLKYFNAQEKENNLSYLEKAYHLQPHNPDTYYEFIVYHILNDEDAKAKEFLEKLYESEDIATGLVNYNYNVLMSTEENAILFTNGDNDTYPCWMLQQAKAVRPDITVMNVHLIRKRPYLENLLKDKNLKIDMKQLPDPKAPDLAVQLCKKLKKQYPKIPIYFALTVNEIFTESISDDLYLVGLAYKYSPTRIDNLAMLRNNWENNLRLDYLKYDWYNENYIATETIQKTLKQNYIPLALSLYEHYKISGEEGRAREVKQLALRIAKPAGKESEVMEILTNE